MTGSALGATAAALAALAALAGPAAAGPSKKDMLRAGEDPARTGPRGAAADPAAATAAATTAGPQAAAPDQAERERWHRELRRRVGKRPAPVINIFNSWTHEFLPVEAGKEVTVPQEMVNRLLRCHFTNHQTDMADELIGVLVGAANHFKVDRVNIVSGFRAPKYNLLLRKKGRRVARNSQHTHGNAVDFRLPGVATKRLRDWARRLRLGGVGYYQHDGFVHVDVGRVRYWAE